MPPRRVNVGKKIIKQKSESEDIYLKTSHLQSLKIPRKPFFRKVKYENLDQAKYVRIKLWKLITFECFPIYEKNEKDNASDDLDNIEEEEEKEDDLDDQDDQDDFGIRRDLGLKFCRMQSKPTLKKSLTHVRKFKSFIISNNLPLHKMFTRCWKLKSLTMTFFDSEYMSQIHKFLKNFVNPKLKSLTMSFHSCGYNMLWLIYKKLSFTLQKFCELEELKLNIPKPRDTLSCEKPLNISSLRRLKRLRLSDSTPIEIFGTKTFHKLTNLEDISFSMDESNFPINEKGENIQNYFAFLPNLNRLNCHSLTLDREMKLLQSPGFKKIQSLKLNLMFSFEYRFDILLQLKDLKFLSLHIYDEPYTKEEERKSIKFPSFTNLEELSLHSLITFKFESIRDYISQNPKLKKLEISLIPKDMTSFFEGNYVWKIESFSMKFLVINPPYAASVRNFVDFLKRHKHLTRLKLYLETLYSDITEPIFKAIGTLALLESFSFLFDRVGEIENLKFNLLNECFGKWKNLKFLTLDTRKKKTSSTELSSLVTGLLKLKNLEGFTYRADFNKVQSYDKFFSFVRSINHLKCREIEVEDQSALGRKRLEALLHGKLPLWTSSAEEYFE